jgi:hypothetical protein
MKRTPGDFLTHAYGVANATALKNWKSAMVVALKMNIASECFANGFYTEKGATQIHSVQAVLECPDSIPISQPPIT